MVALTSFIDVASDSHFPLQNLPFGVFKPDAQTAPRIGVAIGDLVLDLQVIAEHGLLTGPELRDHKIVFAQSSLNAFLALGQSAWREARTTVMQLLCADEATLRDNKKLRAQALHRQDQVSMLLPVTVRGYTDFYSSKEHATNLGKMFRGSDNALMPNWLHMPIGYDGRASSIVVSGTDFARPCGQIMPPNADNPIFSASKRLDAELEVGFIVGSNSKLGEPISTQAAPQHIFGVVLLNDWSARDIQKWEYQPLGPFLGKNFCTSISPWVVTLDALEPFRVSGPKQQPQPLPYLQCEQAWNFNLQLQMLLKTATMTQPDTVATTNFRQVYWNFCQQVAHHTINGCNLRTGDIFASGTVSGDQPGSYGSFIELCWGGKQPLTLSNGETRTFLEDGDSVTITGWCQGDNYRIGFGEVTGTVLPALSK